VVALLDAADQLGVRLECREDPHLFDAETDLYGHAQAAAMCRACPVRPECQQVPMADRTVSGVWGGLFWPAVHGDMPRRPVPAGTHPLQGGAEGTPVGHCEHPGVQELRVPLRQLPDGVRDVHGRL
jgi:hypothetical protein